MKTNRNKTIFTIAALAVLSVGTGYYIAKAANWGFTGFSWIGNNLQEGVEQGDPVIGMISMKGSNYQVTISGDTDQRPLVGSAWLGIGSIDDKFNDFTNQSDYPSLGWIHFNQSFDETRLATLMGNGCFGAGDCWGARWNKKPASTSGYEGYLSGWARMEIGPNGDGSPYPDTWVHFKSPADPNNYACDEGSKNYYVCSDANGRLEGYAWSAGAEAVSVDSNPGLGWIKFGKQYAGLENLGVVAANNGFCATLLDSGASDVACKTDPNFNGQFNFKAYQTGMTLNAFDPNKNYQWTCSPGGAPKEGEKVTCQYDKDGTYSPQLRVYNEATQQWVDCANQTSVMVTSEPSCKVLARKAVAGGDGEFSKELTVSPNDTIEAKVKPVCISDGQVQWTVSGASKLYENGNLAGFKPAGGTAKISAKIVNGGKTLNCGTINVDVKETVKWR